MLKDKKGVSPVIAVVLMIVVAVAISLVVYVWASGYVSEETQVESKAGDYQFLVETRSADTDGVNIRNMGEDITATDNTFSDVFDLYKNDQLIPNADLNGTSGTYEAGDVMTFDFSGCSAGDKVKLVHKDSGTPIVFKLE